MIIRAVLLLCLIAFPQLAAAGLSLEELKAKNKADTSTPQGKAYEMNAVRTFWGDAAFVNGCKPPSYDRNQGPFTIYLVIKPDGKLDQYVIVPGGKAASCIASHTQDRIFPKPSGLYVLKIDFGFTK